MIKIKDNYIHISTNNTSYIFCVTKYGDLQHLYYGAKIDVENYAVLKEDRSVLLINTLYPDGDESYCIDGINFEYSFANRGDSRSVAAIFSDENGGVFDFVFDKAETNKIPETLCATSYEYSESLVVTMKDNCRNVELQLWYLVYENSDVITRFAKVENHEKETINIHKLMSGQLDLFCNDYILTTFDGAWGRERFANNHTVACGSIVGGSHSGMSSAECNPFFMVKEKSTTSLSGNVFAFNLVYSGSHQFCVEGNPYGNVRIMNGIQSESFLYQLPQGQTFITPESVMTFSNEGTNGISKNMHLFVQKYIVRYKGQIPIMLNSWEAMYFDITEEKIKAVIDGASDLGFEAVVVDDGWFGKRNDDTTSLGDWDYDKTKFPNGIKSLAEYCNKKSMIFGIWIEPEMISVKSKLYLNHSDWALKDKKARSIVGRNQYILDLTKKDVQNYICNTVSKIVDEYGVGYLKWDFNRRLCEVSSDINCTSYHYLYTKALYQILERITKKYPLLIIEGCASGGGRFDLGMLRYSPFVWVSDNTDPLSRAEIQEGTSFGYPLNVMLNHVSASPNHQTERVSKMKSRLDIATCGVFGAQLDPKKMCEEDKIALKSAILKYKEDRFSLVNGNIYRLADGQYGNDCIWQIMSHDGSQGKLVIFRKRFFDLNETLKIRLIGLDLNAKYSLSGEGIKVEMTGTTLANCGFILPLNFQSGNHEEKAVRLTDSGSAVFYIQKQI